jgi:very-short-patch-repair endonuclease
VAPDNVLDLYCVERRLAVEVDGDSHYQGDGPAKDERRDALLASKGIRVLRFTNLEVIEELEAVVEVIAGELGVTGSGRTGIRDTPTRPPPRDAGEEPPC